MSKKSVRIDQETFDSMSKVIQVFKEKGIIITKGNLIKSIWIQWLEFQNQEIEKALKEEN